MIDREKLAKSDPAALKAMDDRAIRVQALFDEANLLSQQLHTKAESLPIMALMLLMMQK